MSEVETYLSSKEASVQAIENGDLEVFQHLMDDTDHLEYHIQAIQVWCYAGHTFLLVFKCYKELTLISTTP